MRRVLNWAGLIGVLVGFLGLKTAPAQSSFTATQPLALSGFGGVTGNWTDLAGGRNLGITAGVDLALPTYRRFRPVLEGRGTYAFVPGQIDAQKELLVGLRVERQYSKWHPYVDFLAGRGQLDYQHGGFTYGNLTYISSTTVVYSFGGGLDYDLSHHFAVRGDFQLQHWDTPFPSGTIATPVAVTTGRLRPDVYVAADGTAPQTIYPRMATVALVYRFDFNHHPKRLP